MTDYTLADTIHFMFTTRRFDTGAPFALDSGVISAYENEGLTQITAGITLGADHDGVTGLNLVTVAATGANGFETGKDYHLVITTGTVNSVSVVGECIGRFSIGRSAAAVKLPTTVDGLTIEQILKVLAAAAAGEVSGAETTTVTIRSINDDRDAIVATVDADGNRSAVTLDHTP